MRATLPGVAWWARPTYLRKRPQSFASASPSTSCLIRTYCPTSCLASTRSDRGGRFHNFAVEMPTRMGQDRHRDREPDEQRQEADRQDRRDDQSPNRHGHRILPYRSERCENSHSQAYIAIEAQRKGKDADAKDHVGNGSAA